MPKSLVTGGAGFIGSNLALSLEKLGHEVTVLDDYSSGSELNLENFRGVRLNQPVETLEELPSGTEYVFHQAAITDPRFPSGEELYEKNISGFRRLLDLCVKSGTRLIYASTAGLYGNGPLPMREDQEKECLTTYGRSKLTIDQLAESYFRRTPLISLRYFNVFGPREAHKGRPASMVLHLLRQMCEGKRPRVFKFGEHKRDFVYVEDVIHANLCAMRSPSGIFNVGTGVATSFNELIEELNSVLKTDLKPEYFDMPFDASTYQNHTVADTTYAARVLGFHAQWDLKKAVSHYRDWLLDRAELGPPTK